MSFQNAFTSFVNMAGTSTGSSVMFDQLMKFRARPRQSFEGLVSSSLDSQISQAYNSMQKANMGEVACEDDITDMLEAYFLDYLSESEEELSDEEIYEDVDEIIKPVHTNFSRAKFDEHFSSYSDDKSSEERPLVVISPQINRANIQIGIQPIIPENDIQELELIKQFQCDCKKFNGRQCYEQFTVSEVARIRAECKALLEREKDMVVLSMIACNSEVSHETKCTHQKNGERQQPRSYYSYKHRMICLKTMLFLFYTSRNKVDNCHKWYRINGLCSRQLISAEETARTAELNGEASRVLSYSEIEKIFIFINNYAEENAVVVSGGFLGCSSGNLKLLPSNATKASIWLLYKSAMDTTGQLWAECCTFRRVWKYLCPNIFRYKPLTDLCQTCQLNNSRIFCSANLPEDVKLEQLQLQQDHLQNVAIEREFYNDMILQDRAVLGQERLGTNAPGSREITVHYSLAFSQQIHYPSKPIKAGPLYLLTPRKCGFFGVCCEAIPQQVTYIIDEGMVTINSSNGTVSFLHHFFTKYGLGETNVGIHCMWPGQVIIWYFLWRTIHHLHASVSLTSVISGHYRIGPDWYFGLIKQSLRKTPVSSLEDIVKVVGGINGKNGPSSIAQLVGSENQNVHVPVYDWQIFLQDYFKEIPKIEEFMHFRISSTEPGIVFARASLSDEEVQFELLIDNKYKPPVELPSPESPPGLALNRKHYLHKYIRPFCAKDLKNITCPWPSPEASKLSMKDNISFKRRRIDSKSSTAS